jgi:8-oxo-dGTP pyrophosphatase MutT (NUDIX family)
MKRDPLLSLLAAYKPEPGDEHKMLLQTFEFVTENPECFERTLKIGHVTASGWVVSKEREQVLLMHHQKLDRWFQPGGHCDGDPDVVSVAKKEIEEETGLTNVKLVEGGIFDVDIHLIPSNREFPAHYHYDVRFLFEGDTKEKLIINSESKDVKWVALGEVHNLNDSDSILRMVRKIQEITPSRTSEF